MDEGVGVRVVVSGTDAQGETISLSTTGTLREMEDAWALRYHETLDMIESETFVLCEADRVTVTRSGTLLSTIVFDENETFVGDYVTPHGSFQMRVLTSEVSIRRRGTVGKIHLSYQISLSTGPSHLEETAKRVLDIQFMPCRQ